jgi:hypothetical protein
MDAFSFARFAQYFARCCIMFPTKFPQSYLHVRKPPHAMSTACMAKSRALLLGISTALRG